MPKTARAILQMPPATVAAIEKLGADLAVARLRRKESLKTWAQRMGVSVPTLQRLEAGDLGAGIGIVVTRFGAVGCAQASPRRHRVGHSLGPSTWARSCSGCCAVSHYDLWAKSQTGLS